MKVFGIILTLSLFASLGASAAQQIATLEDGSTVQIQEDACRDPVTGRMEPCLLAVGESMADQDACYNPSTGRLEPCLSATRTEDQAPACYDPVTKRWGPCW